MATGDNGSRCACSFGSLWRGRAADASACAARSPASAVAEEGQLRTLRSSCVGSGR